MIEFEEAAPSGGGYEIRYADQGWGDTNNKNFLVYDTLDAAAGGKTTALEFKVARRRDVAVFVKKFDSAGNYSRFATGMRIVFPAIPGNPSRIIAKGGTLTHPVFKAELPINSSGKVVLNSDVFGLVGFFTHALSLSTNVFGTAVSPFTPIGIDNPGPYGLTPTDDGFQYEGATVTLAGSPSGDEPFSDSEFFNFETDIPMVKGVSIFFCWIRAVGITEDDGLYIRLNIKDDLLPGQSVQPFGFYSRHDYLLTGDWQPLFTVADFPAAPTAASSTAVPNYNLVIHNINTTAIDLKVCLPFIGTSIHNHSDIVLGASEDSPGLSFTYRNIGATT